MPVTRKHLMNAKLTGHTRYDQWKRKFEAAWNADALEAMKAMIWRNMNPEVKEQLRLRVPDAVKDMDERYPTPTSPRTPLLRKERGERSGGEMKGRGE